MYIVVYQTSGTIQLPACFTQDERVEAEEHADTLAKELDAETDDVRVFCSFDQDYSYIPDLG